MAVQSSFTGFLSLPHMVRQSRRTRHSVPGTAWLLQVIDMGMYAVATLTEPQQLHQVKTKVAINWLLPTETKQTRNFDLPDLSSRRPSVSHL